jgi:D-alanyl-D-alanine carboxypeptidase
MVAGLRRTVAFSLAAVLLFCSGTIPASAKYAAIVIDANDGRVVHAVNADTRNYPASLTKIMTLYMVFEALDNGGLEIDQRLAVSARAAGQAPSKLGLAAGETIPVRDAIRALVTKSANDVATAVAEAIGGTEAQFARMMTRRARAIGMQNTTFRNASGLPNRGQLSTARDMAVLARSMLDTFPHHYHYFSLKAFDYKDRTFENHNTLLTDYDGADGIKTGYIRASGFNLVASVERDGMRLIGVVFGGKSARSRDLHMQTLLNHAWDDASTRVYAAAQPAPKPEPPIGMGPALTPMKAVAMAGSGGGSGNWAIQIGAYNAFGAAHAAASAAVHRMRGLPPSASIEVTPFRTRGSILYRARLIGFDETGAREQCRQWRRRGNSCAIVTPSGTVQLAGLPN